jgi:hypothetical protein
MTKRFTLAALSALALIAGLVAGPAAVAGDPPYPGTVTTTTTVKAPSAIKSGKTATINVTVKSRGSGEPEGRLTISVEGPGGFDRTGHLRYNGRTVHYSTGKLSKPGKYKVTAVFDGEDSVFRNSRATATITVKKKKN